MVFTRMLSNVTKPEYRMISLKLVGKADAQQVPHLQHMDNTIRTSYYTVWNFIFLNAYKQLHRAANVYFLLIMFLQMWQEVSITRGEPSMASPLAFVLLVTALKDALEDWSRHKYDRIENSRLVQVLERTDKDTGEMHFASRTWDSLKVGSVVRIKNRDMIPADIALLQCADQVNNVVYVMTAGLDGETNLKQRQVPPQIPPSLHSLGASCKVTCNLPNKILESFDGALSYEEDGIGVQIPLTSSNILLRGSQLRNSDWAVGVVVYAGAETKLQLNAATSTFKTSSAMAMAQQLMTYIFAMQCFLCLGAALMVGVHSEAIEDYFYLWVSPKKFAEEMTLRFFNYVIIFTNFIPISLLVTIDMVKFGQGFFISWDLGMYHAPSDRATKTTIQVEASRNKVQRRSPPKTVPKAATEVGAVVLKMEPRKDCGAKTP
ncbi:Phospholipid-transporting ATPase [Hondaea fermentalgiana]|uniref:Phospholipid-transporting ATPase n=1 Tax=Hondaea fermentalgiana TaxID=2315210 RepID=A0A2R5GRE4_9STRA|nr:Phospholipid-transporting ATPase [Hondaea fermentalgiana]|eukprot:GBG33452.1 Phospholipid-transporting ATPase [Hondaea fermentalgiana]